MTDDTLFPLNPPEPTGRGEADGPARYETANRAQVELRPSDLEGLLPPGHAARLVWRFVEGLELGRFYAAIQAREGGPGRTPIDPKILIALWLYATIDGVGSARAVDRLCFSHDAYRWIRGGVSVNYHTLSDFRVAHQAALDEVLTQSIAALLHGGIVRLARVAQDGTRVRASAGVGSFRREGTLQKCLRTARTQVARTARQDDGGVGSRELAAQERAARERLARVEEALAQLPALAAIKARHRKKSDAAPRASTTDPDARVMKMSDGGFRPGYNVQFATDVGSRVIVGVTVITSSSDNGQLVPMLNEIDRRTGRAPDEMLVDGGYVSGDSINAATRRGTILYAPAMAPKGARPATEPRPGDSLSIALWRRRMGTDAAKQIYKERAATAEWVNADARTHRTLTQLSVRGREKVHTWALWAALAHNMMQTMEIVPHLMT
jgi:transposase